MEYNPKRAKYIISSREIVGDIRILNMKLLLRFHPSAAAWYLVLYDGSNAICASLRLQNTR